QGWSALLPSVLRLLARLNRGVVRNHAARQPLIGTERQQREHRGQEEPCRVKRELDALAARLEHHHQRLEAGRDNDDGDELGDGPARFGRGPELSLTHDLRFSRGPELSLTQDLLFSRGPECSLLRRLYIATTAGT